MLKINIDQHKKKRNKYKRIKKFKKIKRIKTFKKIRIRIRKLLHLSKIKEYKNKLIDNLITYYCKIKIYEIILK
jgi:hypothetical protein